MAELLILAEGQTERTFARDVIGPHLNPLGIRVDSTLLNPKDKITGKSQGGALSYLKVKRYLQQLMQQDRRSVRFFTTMIDLYKLPTDFPGYAAAEALRHLPAERVASLEAALADDVAASRFIPYLQLHEFEACLFVEPAALAPQFDNAKAPIKRLEQVAAGFETPELINDGEQTAPSKRIIAEFPRYAKEKSRVGPVVAQQIGLPAIRAKCPHFHAWISRLEQLGAPPNQP